MKTHRPSRYTCGLLAGFYGRRDDADVIDTGGMTVIDYGQYLTEVEILITLDEHDFVVAGRENFGEARGKVLKRDLVFVDQVSRLLAGVNLDHDGTCIYLGILVLRRLRYQRVEAVHGAGLDDHEDDQQHQKNVDKRSDINVRALAAS